MRNDGVRKFGAAFGIGVLLCTLAVAAIAAVMRPPMPAPRSASSHAVAEAVAATDRALAARDVTGALRAWHGGYLAAMQERGRWDGLIAIGDARVRIAGTDAPTCPKRIAQRDAEHRLIAEAIARRDPEAAEAAMRAHLLAVQKQINERTGAGAFAA